MVAVGAGASRIEAGTPFDAIFATDTEPSPVLKPVCAMVSNSAIVFFS